MSSTYSERHIEARYGYNKSKDGLKAIKLLTLYSIESRQPMAFTKQAGNLPDVITIENTLSQMSVLGVKSAEINLHIYFNAARQAEDRTAFETNLMELKALLEGGMDVGTLSERSQEKVRKYMSIRTWGNKTTVSINDKACREAYKYHGYFVLVSNREKDCFECLRKYRRRETIEAFFKSGKQHADGARTRVRGTDTLRGRMFVQFVSLCYYEYLSEKIRQIKSSLGKQGSDDSRTKETYPLWVRFDQIFNLTCEHIYSCLSGKTISLK